MNKEAIRELLLANAETVKDQIRLGSNTEAGFTGHLVYYRGADNPIELWVGKDLLALKCHVEAGNMEPEISRHAQFDRMEKVRFSNLFVVLLNEVEEQLSTGKLGVGTLLNLLIEGDGAA